MFEKIKEAVTIGIASFHAAKRVRGWNFMYSECEILGEPIYLSDDFVLLSSGSLNANAVIDGQGNIMVNQALLDSDILEATIAHEIGHKIYGHNKKNLQLLKLQRMLGCKEAVKLELEADKYAAEKTSKEAVIRMIEVIYEKYPNNKEAKIRIAALRAM